MGLNRLTGVVPTIREIDNTTPSAEKKCNVSDDIIVLGTLTAILTVQLWGSNSAIPPADGDRLMVQDGKGTAATYVVTVSVDGDGPKDIINGAGSKTFNSAYGALSFVYSNASGGWLATNP